MENLCQRVNIHLTAKIMLLVRIWPVYDVIANSAINIKNHYKNCH